ncbi:hypothetical protein PCANC_04169 [Puccinia coronata f. sp. avenae]|uniref:Uncharacterized protein n=1 Tax=Puccinia coronata f. sp. avenae TaxID=200324 RepID=A0A2N5W7B9_9BASI|nr:hypothetical protein PCANC_04169 [Puccinia coronata f. sp. avenae]
MVLWKYCSNSPLSLHHFFLTRYKITLSLTLSIPPSFNSPLSVKSQRPAFIGNSSYPVLSFGLFEIHEIDTSELSARAESGYLSYKSTTLFLRENRNITLEVKLHALSLRIDALKKDHVYFASGKHYKPYNISRTVQPKRMLVIQAGLPNHVELPERSGRLQSPWRKVLGGPAASARRPMPASQKNTVRNTRMAGTAAANRNLIARPQAQQAAGKSQDSATFHLHIGLLQLPASSIPPMRAGDKRIFSAPNRTRTTWGQDSTVPPQAVLWSKGEIR